MVNKRIDEGRKITGWEIVSPDEPKLADASTSPVGRPEVLSGVTYKIKTPLSEAALYVTINNLNGRPFEIFVNSKSMEHFQWIVALTRVMSAVFRQTDNCFFLVEELKSVFDPRGGYWKPQEGYVASLVAEIGVILALHINETCHYGVPKPVKKQKQCSLCGGEIVVSEGCEKCLQCDWSRCS